MALANIPNGLTDDHFDVIKKYLGQALNQLRSAGAKRVTSRLNCSGTEAAIPVWAGTVEHKNIESMRRGDTGWERFGRTNRSKAYEDALTDSQGKIHERNWAKDFHEKGMDGYGPGDGLGPRAKCMHQLFIAIRIEQNGKFRHVGTLTVGFERPPSKAKVESMMKRLAQKESSYVKYLRKTFNLGGPVFFK